MKKTIGYIIIFLAIVFSLLSYFVVTQDPNTKEFTDGLGRELVKAPMTFKIMTGVSKDLWAGFLWFIVDNFLILIGLTIGYSLISDDY